MQCQIYEDLRGQFSNLEDDTQLVNFFSAVLDRRGRLEEEDRRTEDKRTEVALPLIAARHPGAPPV